MVAIALRIFDLMVLVPDNALVFTRGPVLGGRVRIQFRFGKPGCQSQGGPLVPNDATKNRLAPKS